MSYVRLSISNSNRSIKKNCLYKLEATDEVSVSSPDDPGRRFSISVGACPVSHQVDDMRTETRGLESEDFALMVFFDMVVDMFRTSECVPVFPLSQKNKKSIVLPPKPKQLKSLP